MLQALALLFHPQNYHWIYQSFVNLLDFSYISKSRSLPSTCATNHGKPRKWVLCLFQSSEDGLQSYFTIFFRNIYGFSVGRKYGFCTAIINVKCLRCLRKNWITSLIDILCCIISERKRYFKDSLTLLYFFLVAESTND